MKMNDEYTFTLTEDTILQRFQTALEQNGGSFISYKRTNYCSDQLFEVISLLELMGQRYPERAKAVAEKMIDVLLHTDTDDDWFPLSELKELYEIAGEVKELDEIGEIYCSYR